MERQNVVEVVKNAFESAVNNLESLLNEIDKDSEIRKETEMGKPIRHAYEAQSNTFFLLELFRKTKLGINAIRVERPYRELLSEFDAFTYCDICLKFDSEVWVETKFLTNTNIYNHKEIVKDIDRLQRVKNFRRKNHCFLMVIVSDDYNEKLTNHADWTKLIGNTASVETYHFKNNCFHGYLIELKFSQP